MIHHYLINECGMNPAEVAVHLKGWEIRPIMDDDIIVGEIMLHGSEIHVAFSKTFRSRGLFKKRNKVAAFFGRLLDEKKFLTTKSLKGDSTEPFIKRLGFVKTKSDARFNYWWLDRLPGVAL